MADILGLILVAIIVLVFVKLIKVTPSKGSAKNIIVGLTIFVAAISIPTWIVHFSFMIHPVLGVIVAIPSLAFILYVLGRYGKSSKNSELWNNEGGN